MDVIERLNRRFGAWYEGLFGAASDRDLRPRDILRRLLAAMEDARREGLDGHIYVPNVYTLQIAVADDDERDYLRTFLSADDLSAAVLRAIEQHGYHLKGGLSFQIEELPAEAVGGERVRIRTRFDALAPVAPSAPPHPATPSAISLNKNGGTGRDDEDDEPGTVIGIPAQILASLVVRGSDGHLQEVYPVGPGGVRIGRSRRSGNDIVLADGMISKRHAALIYDAAAGRFLVRDEGSTNGTFLNGARLPSGEARSLAPGDQILLGETTLTFRPAGERAVEAAPEDREPPAPAPPPFPAVGDLAPLALVAADDRVYPLTSEMTLGRGVTSDLVLDGDGVASQHARLFRQTPAGGGEERIYIEDLGSVPGTFVNGERIPARFPVALYAGDELAFGSARLRVERRRLTRGASA